MTFSFAVAVACALALLVAMLLVLVRLFGGPTLYDRVLAVNTFGTLTVLLLATLAAIIGRPDPLDIAILYALINFIATIAILKFFRYRTLDRALASTDVSFDDTPSGPREGA